MCPGQDDGRPLLHRDLLPFPLRLAVGVVVDEVAACDVEPLDGDHVGGLSLHTGGQVVPARRG